MGGDPESETVVQYHPNHVGSNTMLTNAAGGVIKEDFMEPFGDGRVTVAGSGGAVSLPSSNVFTDQEHDPETGLDYFGARYYDPTIGRFLSSDPALIGPEEGPTFRSIAGDGQASNPFAYAMNRPTVVVDPTGAYGELVGITIALTIELKLTYLGETSSSFETTVMSFGEVAPNAEAIALGLANADVAAAAANVTAAEITGSTGGSGGQGASEESTSTLEGSLPPAAGQHTSGSSVDPLAASLANLNHVLEELAAAQLTLWSGVAATGASATATGVAVLAIPETGGISMTLLPFTMTSTAGGIYLTLTGVNANVDAFNSLFQTTLPNLNALLPRIDGQPPFATFPALSPSGH